MTDILLLGPYGSGKTTQTQRLARAWGYEQFSAGTALRHFTSGESDLARELKAIMAKGELIAAHFTIDLLRADMANKTTGHYIIDGTPRAMDQLALFDALMLESGREYLPIVIEISDAESLRRQVERRTCARCQLATTLAETRCPACGSTDFVTRPDNDPAIAAHRVAVYHAETDPVIAHYRDRGLIIIDGERPAEAVTEDIVMAITRHRLAAWQE